MIGKLTLTLFLALTLFLCAGGNGHGLSVEPNPKRHDQPPPRFIVALEHGRDVRVGGDVVDEPVQFFGEFFLFRKNWVRFYMKQNE